MSTLRDRILAKRKRLRCVDCGDAGMIVVDQTEGSQICVNCGRVAENVLISEQQEWRSFSAESSSGKNNDRNRVGEANDVWMETTGGTTFIGASRKMQNTHNMVINDNDNKRHLKSAFVILRQVDDTMNLSDLVIERSKEMLKELDNAGHLKGRCNMLNVLSIVYMASREVGVCRSLDELTIYEAKISQRDLSRAIGRMKKLLPQRGNATVEDSAQIIPRFCNRLNINERMTLLCEYVANKAAMLLRTSHRTTSLAGGIIYFITQVAWRSNASEKAPTIADIANVCGTSESTIKSTYKELLKVSHLVLPNTATSNAA
uniref:General transcription factor TFIIB n=1 Tax=Babesia bovis TaxID=5865 RepID=S6BH50_BABBO|nr:transcription initiation factor TFIIB, putative [Babesia bovis]